MPTGTPVGHVIKSLTLTIDTTDYSCPVTAAEFVRGGRTKQTSATACGIVTDYGPAEDVLHVEFNVDKTAASLYRLLIDNEGDEVTATLLDDHSGVTESATVRLTPGTPAGKIGEFHTATVDLGVIGAITITDPPVTP